MKHIEDMPVLGVKSMFGDHFKDGENQVFSKVCSKIISENKVERIEMGT